MTLEEIKQFPIDDYADENCHIYLWTINKFLRDAFDVLKGWGFKFHVVLVWRKPTGVTPFSFQFVNEYVLFGYRGKFKIGKMGIPTTFDAKVRQHSRKPDKLYGIADFEWIGFPHAEERRDYELSAFLKLTEEKKRWYLGYHDGRSPSDLLLFDAFDTTLPSTKAGRFGLLWMGWNQTKEVSHLNIPTYEIIEFNIISLKIALRELFLTRDTHLKLSEFNDPSFIFTEEDVKGMFSELCANSE